MLRFSKTATDEENKSFKELEEIHGLQVNREFQSKNFRERKDKEGNREEAIILTLHYSATPFDTTMGIFTNNPQLAEKNAEYFENTGTNLTALCNREISAHYVVSEQGKLHQLVDEAYAAYAAGVSYWDDYKNINNKSISVMNVGQGFKWLNKFPEDRAVTVPGSDKTWFSFTEEQIEATIALCKDIIEKYGIKPYNIIGNGDAAYTRHVSPGPVFPWQRLAEAGIGLWYDLEESAINLKNTPDDPTQWMCDKLTEFGYKSPRELEGEFDDNMRAAMKAFQMHFRPGNIDGEIDLECMQIVDSLCERKIQCQLDAINTEISRPKLFK